MNFDNVKEIMIPEGNVREIIDSTEKSLWKAGPGYIYLKLIDRSISAYTNETVESIGKDAFNNCSALTSVSFPVATNIGDNTFWNCSVLTTIDFPAVTSIGSNAFKYCSALTTADFPAVTSIGYSAFYGCTKLTTADFPLATSIGSYSFQSCSKLTALILRSETMAKLSSIDTFNSTPIKSGTGYIYVPAALVDSYKAASKWSTYANQIRAIEDYPEITGGETA